MNFYRLRETLLELDCLRCNGEGWPDEQECGSCFGSGFVHVDVTWIVTLVDNLATAGALVSSFRAGDNFGFHMGADETQCTCQWSPGHGAPYAGFSRCEQEIAIEESDHRYIDEDFIP